MTTNNEIITNRVNKLFDEAFYRFGSSYKDVVSFIVNKIKECKRVAAAQFDAKHRKIYTMLGQAIEAKFQETFLLTIDLAK